MLLKCAQLHYTQSQTYYDFKAHFGKSLSSTLKKITQILGRMNKN